MRLAVSGEEASTMPAILAGANSMDSEKQTAN
jgi:hypothetical protein